MTNETITLCNGRILRGQRYEDTGEVATNLLELLAAESKLRAAVQRSALAGEEEFLSEHRLREGERKRLLLARDYQQSIIDNLRIERHLWQAIARAAEAASLSGVILALNAARAAGLTWEEKE